MNEAAYAYQETTIGEIDHIAESAHEAFLIYRKTPAAKKAAFLLSIGEAIDRNRNFLSQVAQKETALPDDRLQSEITRTINQCKLFAEVLKEGSWKRAIIDTAEPERKPAPRPDLRQVQQPLGPVAVFGASNFPFAYSVCGGDTVAALAAGCPVIYKANPGHPETSEHVTRIVIEAAKSNGLPDGTFAMVQGRSNETGTHLVTHPRVMAVGFTGSLRGGRALFDAAAKREVPIPVYAEMGSTNPVFILPEMLAQKGEEIAKLLAASNMSSVGQFCTNPGIMVAKKASGSEKFYQTFSDIIRNTPSSEMLNKGIHDSFEKSMKKMEEKKSVTLLAATDAPRQGQGEPHAFSTNADSFLGDKELWEEMFGPSSIQVTATDTREMIDVALALPGQITTSVWGTPNDLAENRELLDILELKAGRMVINGVPTGVEVTHAMNHGGPYPATTDSKFTSVGTQSIYRFTRPVCYQNFPQEQLPDELKDKNFFNIWRMINGNFTKENV
jgi:NADP-dependent aldehyde dehydrogenase